MITIDGATLEGGGQIPRIAVALSALTHTPIRITHIRANRPSRGSHTPAGGLKSQHALAIAYLASATGGTASGCHVGSQELVFRPGRARLVRETVEIAMPTPGAVTLVLQTLVPFFVLVPGRRSVRIAGGTHVSCSPSVSYFQHVAAHVLAEMGARVSAVKTTRCFSERGWNGRLGGVEVDVCGLDEGQGLQSLDWAGSRGEVEKIGLVVLAPRHEVLSAVKDEVRRVWEGVQVDVLEADKTDSMGQWYILLVLETTTGRRLGADWLLEGKDLPLTPRQKKMGDLDMVTVGKMAQVMTKRVTRELQDRWASGAGLDQHMEDQVVVYQALSLADGGSSSSKAASVLEEDRQASLDDLAEMEQVQDEHGALKSVPKKRAEGTLHTLTARWVAGEILGVVFDGQGKCQGVGCTASKHGQVH